MKIDASQVRELRERTGAGIMDCKTALVESEGDMEAAVELLRRKGTATAEKKSVRSTAEGVIGSYVHSNSKVATLVELNCESDFVARNEEFSGLAKDLCMQVAAMDPIAVSRDDVPEDVIEKEREVYRAQIEDKPDHIAEKIVEGKLSKFYQNACLLEQPFIKDDKQTIEDLITAKIAKLGENIRVNRFCRFVVGESED